MYIGIYINQSFISAAYIDPYEGVKFFSNEFNFNGHPTHLAPLDAVIDGEYAYLGNQVIFLEINNPEIMVYRDFFNDILYSEAPLLNNQDISHWESQDLLSLFLRKIKTDFEHQFDLNIQGVILSSSLPSSPETMIKLQKAFDQVNLNLIGHIEIEKSILMGYGILSNIEKSSYNLLINLDPKELTLSVFQKNQNDDIIALNRNVIKRLGGNRIYKKFSELLIENYQKLTNQQIKETPKESILFKTKIKTLLGSFLNEHLPYYTVLLGFQSSIVEMIITRKHITEILFSYMSELNELISQELSEVDTTIHNIKNILISGTSYNVYFINEYLKHKLDDDVQLVFNLPDQIAVKGSAIIANDNKQRLHCKSITENCFNTSKLLNNSTLEDKHFKSKSEKISKMNINISENI